MKKKLYFSIFAGALLACSCQNELYKDATSEYQSAQGLTSRLVNLRRYSWKKERKSM